MSITDGQIEQVAFEPGETLFHENEQSFHFFIIQEGQVEVFKTGVGGVKLPLAVVGDGTSIGEFAMIDRLPRSATARALTKVVAAKVSDQAYQQLIQELPDWAVSVMRALVERLRQTNEIVRRGGIVSKDVKQAIDAIEFDPDASTEVDTNPMLGSGGDDDDSNQT
ncbi:MAG: cyclic nucleotide-binding domain-containing protein [Bdellovibrionota bacterium]